MLQTPRMNGYILGPSNLLIFKRGETENDIKLPGDGGGVIPGHGLSSKVWEENVGVELKTHFALAVQDRQNVLDWEKHLLSKEVRMLGKIEKWPFGGMSIYFEDPDKNVGEIACKGIWKNY